MKIIKKSDEQIIKKWKKYCERNSLRYVEPNLPLNRSDEWCVKLENEKGWLSVFYPRPDSFLVNDSLMKTTEQRIEEIMSLLEEAKDKLEALRLDTEEYQELQNDLSVAIEDTERAMETLI